ncbi:MAG: LLM class flavin-dependent oxidoreductase, partial [Gammaproteobacteria bacterium]|nr:LLM class flavin-dependent oxidoreductase [Gammaproteobacteria bacterium]
GQDFHTRGRRVDEMLDIIPQLLTGEMTEFHGEFYDIPPVKMSPGITRPLPIMIGGYAPAALRRACRFSGWMATSHPEEEIYPLIDTLREVRESSGDAARPFDIWTGVQNPDDSTHERLAEAGVTMVNGTNFLAEDGRTALSSIEDKKRRLEDFARRFL